MTATSIDGTLALNICIRDVLPCTKPLGEKRPRLGDEIFRSGNLIG